MFIAGHHEGYIPWDTYQRDQDTVRGKASNVMHDEATLAVRSGQGWLVGLLGCARCGRKLQICYWGKQGTAARYLCSGDFDTGGSYGLGFGGATVERRRGAVILRALSPLGRAASLQAIAQSRVQGSDRRAALERQWQQVRYEAERAFVQYDQVEPGNRLVAEVLEHRWNAKLEAQQHVARELGKLNDMTAALTSMDEVTLRAMAENFAVLTGTTAPAR